MASFAGEVKKELTTIQDTAPQQTAELIAFIKMNGSLAIVNHRMRLDIQTENAAIARRIYGLLKSSYQLEPKVVVRRKMKLKKNNVYMIQLEKNVTELLQKLEIFVEEGLSSRVAKKFIYDEATQRAYLRAAFMAGGSINNPETSSYHLEIYSLYEEHTKQLVEMMNRYGLNARQISRRNGSIAYLKDAEHISDFLVLIGATKAILRFENVRATRNIRNTVNRRLNFESANLNKTINAAGKQIEAIEKIKEEVGIGELPQKLQEVALLRLEHPEVSLKELGELMPEKVLSKSAINHRLRKIVSFAEGLKNKKEKQE